jgi:hypothetical protein
MPGRYVFDCETDGLLPELTKLHCLGIRCLDTGKVWSCGSVSAVAEGLERLRDADLIIGHNIIGFDIPALQKVYPWFQPKGLVRDTIVLTRLMWPHISEDDWKKHPKGLPKILRKPQSLAAWGFRLGELKEEYSGGWEKWSPEMQAYMDQDVVVTEKLWRRIEKEAELWGVPLEDPNPPPKKDCIELEHRVAEICLKVEQHGFRFDFERAVRLVSVLTARKQELTKQLLETFPPERVETIFTPKVNNKARGYAKGVPFTKVREVPFNPGSRQQVGKRLMALGWKPQQFGADGTPTVDDEVLTALPYPEAKLLAEYYTVDKRLGQIANGNEAWFRHDKGGRIHGRIASGGAHTGRMTHSKPNMAQVPGNHAPYGEECRSCFLADGGYVLVGCDADALELRDLAGYMANWDGGAYIDTVLRGDKKIGTDMHTINAKLIGCDRDTAKTFFYAMIYGSGDPNLGAVIGKNAGAGKAARERLMKGVPALGALVKAVHAKVEQRGYLVGLDGRRLRARAKNAALNTLLQSAGAVQMKRGLVILVDQLTEKGWVWGKDYAIVGLIHDEWQSNVLPEKAEEFGEVAARSIRDAGTYYDFKCPLDGQFKVGKTWKDTH